MTVLSDCQWPEHWPAHGSMRACGEGDCTRCGMEQEHEESHEGEPCPWDLWERGAELAQRADWERDCYEEDVDWNVATSEHLPARPGDTS